MARANGLFFWRFEPSEHVIDLHNGLFWEMLVALKPVQEPDELVALDLRVKPLPVSDPAPYRDASEGYRDPRETYPVAPVHSDPSDRCDKGRFAVNGPDHEL
jgi:hypothetical protein